MARLPFNDKGSGQSAFGDNTGNFNSPGIVAIKTGERSDDTPLKVNPWH